MLPFWLGFCRGQPAKLVPSIFQTFYHHKEIWFQEEIQVVEDFFLKWVYLGKICFHFSYGRKYFFLHELLALWATTLWAEHKQGSFVTF